MREADKSFVSDLEMGKLFLWDAYNKDASLQLALLIQNTARDI